MSRSRGSLLDFSNPFEGWLFGFALPIVGFALGLYEGIGPAFIAGGVFAFIGFMVLMSIPWRVSISPGRLVVRFLQFGVLSYTLKPETTAIQMVTSFVFPGRPLFRAVRKGSVIATNALPLAGRGVYKRVDQVWAALEDAGFEVRVYER